jgi:hypothetical protein
MVASGLKRVEAHFFVTDGGREPVRDWLLDLDRNDRRDVGRDLMTLESSTEHYMKAKRASSAKRNVHTGTRVSAVLDEDDLLEDAEAVAIKRVLAWQLEESMKAQGMSKHALAKRACPRVVLSSIGC